MALWDSIYPTVDLVLVLLSHTAIIDVWHNQRIERSFYFGSWFECVCWGIMVIVETLSRVPVVEQKWEWQCPFCYLLFPICSHPRRGFPSLWNSSGNALIGIPRDVYLMWLHIRSNWQRVCVYVWSCMSWGSTISLLHR